MHSFIPAATFHTFHFFAKHKFYTLLVFNPFILFSIKYFIDVIPFLNTSEGNVTTSTAQINNSGSYTTGTQSSKECFLPFFPSHSLFRFFFGEISESVLPGTLMLNAKS